MFRGKVKHSNRRQTTARPASKAREQGEKIFKHKKQKRCRRVARSFCWKACAFVAWEERMRSARIDAQRARGRSDRCGKTTQCRQLVASLTAAGVACEALRFPDRTTLTGEPPCSARRKALMRSAV